MLNLLTKITQTKNFNKDFFLASISNILHLSSNIIEDATAIKIFLSETCAVNATL